ncbi:hypothetical protein IE077_004381 [Cardiosporidium cionae]|uniref:Uncharacterized protein n=1 Tax=Cardiosporidium cionae TaxID=476202 RepID=A0ABQ7JBR3_9APIC|nr:hypothetical protein IE077_004381 [Cardiosporidium cionae]|eukprot:KAF8821110.1 hypothetical protein IE077_004381 [Cardiosporidium cionae]
MGFFIPALFFGGLGMSHLYATKELDDIFREGDQPLFGFWWGAAIGLLGGIWIGWNSAETVFAIWDPVKSFFFPSTNSSNEEKGSKII